MSADQPNLPLVHKPIWASSGPILLLLGISALAILGLVFLAAIWAGRESDAAALDRQRNLVNNRLQDQVERVSQDIQLMGAGYASLLMTDTKSVRQTDLKNATSAEAFGQIATRVFGYNAAFLVTRLGELALDSDQETIRRFKWVRPLLHPMIQDLESKRAARSLGKGPDLSSGRVELMRLEGRPSVAGVISIKSSPDDASLERDDSDIFYLVAFRFLDGVTLDTFSREQGLAGARYARTADQEQNEVAFQIEATATGEPIGFIIWTPDLPGSRVVGRLVPLLSFAGLLIAVLFVALMARLRRSLKELSASEHHARHLSVHDVLTGLPNRALFSSRFEKCLAAMSSPGRQSVLALIDLDRFKEVNDIYGHPVGDGILRAVVDRMNALLQPGDTLARVGGDEFALLLPDVEYRGSHLLVLNTIIEELGKPFQLHEGGPHIRIGSSIGFAVFHNRDHATGEILRRADVALYEAKTRGRGCWVEYDTIMDHRFEARESLKNDLRLVLEDQTRFHDGAGKISLPVANRLEVFFQGVHRADDCSKLSGAEALVRWHHPVLGFLSPDKFIPIAEEAGLIDQLGEWVLRNAAQAAANWPLDMSLAVNVSPSQIRHPDFDRIVLSILAETGLKPSRLELELTEAALFKIDENAVDRLRVLRSHGIRVALDDFGTGFSSLSHLIQFNIDRIKIDRSFVTLIGTQAEGAAIVSAILGLSRSLGKATTAEGVETQGQSDFLIAAGCSDLQGFLFSRPMPLVMFERSFLLGKTEESEPVYSSRG